MNWINVLPHYHLMTSFLQLTHCSTPPIVQFSYRFGYGDVMS